MPVVPVSDALRTLNLSYRHLQHVFRTLQPDLFRGHETLTTDASGYLNLPTYVLEVEDIRTSGNLKVNRIDVEERTYGTGYYPEGINTAGGGDDGKRRFMVREGGVAKASTSYVVHYLREFSDLASTSATPYPFTSKAYLDMLTSLQAYYWLSEQGNERKSEKEERYKEFERHLELAGFDAIDDEPEYLMSSHPDSGDRRSSPILNVSSS